MGFMRIIQKTMTIDQIIAILIFLAMFICIMLDKWHRYLSALGGAILTLVLVFRNINGILWALNIDEIFRRTFWITGTSGGEPTHGINWQTIIFIAGMMIMIEGLERIGFFRWLCLLVAKKVKYRVLPIFIAFFLLSGFLAMFIDSITVLLFISSVTIELARLLKFNPVPMIIAEIFAANTGGSATMAGDPPNIIIGTYFHFSFFDFLSNTGIIAWISMLVALGYFFLIFRKSLVVEHPPGVKYPQPKEAIKNRLLFYAYAVIFMTVIILLITHNLTGMSVAFIGCIAAFLSLLIVFKDCPEILKNFDWRIMVFFIGLFICVSGLEHSGVLNLLANFIVKLSGGNLILVVSMILWISAFASAIVDNIPFAATLVPVIASLAKSGMPLETLSWSLALGADIGGNGTPIGASANVVGIARAEEEGYRVSWSKYCLYALPAMIIIILLCNFYLIIRYF
jgi:Na+/H+ antiporter NhaD/arsenite permease-like protein